jgi:hypothetical protein
MTDMTKKLSGHFVSGTRQGTGTLIIRTDLDWERDVYPIEVSSDGNTGSFEVEAQQPFVNFKPCLIKNRSLHRAVGPNNLLILAGQDSRVLYPLLLQRRAATSSLL